MRDVLVFGGGNSLDFFDVRQAVLRIPEVQIRIKEAQAIWDKVCGAGFSLQHFLASEDHNFFKNINNKNLSLAIVQMGLYDRYVRQFRVPKYLIGNIENDATVNVAANILTFEELVANSKACMMDIGSAPLPVPEIMDSSLPLQGQSLPKYRAFTGGEAIAEPQPVLQKCLADLVENEGVRNIIHVGPGALDAGTSLGDLTLIDVQLSESIDVDPMLGWFWRSLRGKQAQKPAAC